MSELRRDHLHDTWVITAPERGARPHDVRMQAVPTGESPCPFCPGNESQTPPEILAIGRGAGTPADGPDWRVRIVPNRYPAVTGGEGRHEVVVISPDHACELADLTADEAGEVLAAVQQRYRDLEADPELASVLFFLNSGAGAGASLSHPHGQVLATPVVPAVLCTELAAVANWRRQHAGCLICDLADEAERDGRLVHADQHAIVIAPRASRFSWEMILLPRRHAARFTDSTLVELKSLGAALAVVCRALRAAAADPAYNLVLHSAPSGAQDFHWHLELLPRLAPLAGFEMGTGFHINPILPELAAQKLRRALTDDQEGTA